LTYEDRRPRFRRRAGDLAADPQLWEALGRGHLLRQILESFYAIVYEDERLAPFFHNVTREHAVSKQYSFLMDIITGERVYFGDRPRNAHHWMVISSELFDYREALLEACMRKHGLAEPFIARWLQIDEVFRKQIVKDAPFPRKLDGRELPLEGYEVLELVIGCVCDGCEGEMHPGTRATAHVRTGKTFCAGCRPLEADTASGSDALEGGRS